jgi:hypothetical protein
MCAVLAMCVCASGGCVSFRKKFVRKSKADQGPELFLELKKYEDVPTEELYRPHFLYVKGWLEELSQLVQSNGNRKRMKKSIDAAIESFAQINAYLTDEGKEKLKPLYDRMLALRDKVYDPFKINAGTRYTTVAEVDAAIVMFKTQCAYDEVYPYFVDRDKAESPAKG